MEIVSVKYMKHRFEKFLFPSVREVWKNRHKYIFNDLDRPVVKKRVNLFWAGTYNHKV